MRTQKEIEDDLILYNKKYREGNPIVTDIQYDILLRCLEENYPDSLLLKKAVLEDTPTSRKEQLPYPMFSLDKLKSMGELDKWFARFPSFIKIVITPKFDGISLLVNDNSGECWTRGNGIEGQRSDEYFRKMNCSSKFANKFNYSFGEAIMSKGNFSKFYKGEFASARNLVAGLFNKKEISDALGHVSYMRYGSDNIDKNKDEQLDMLNFINEVTVPYLLIEKSLITKSLLNDLFRQWGEQYQIDGLVVELNDLELRNKMGREVNNNPAYARAIKLPEWNPSHQTKVTGVTWKVSKQGKLKPVINVEPVDIDGVIVENVTGYNARYMVDNNIAPESFITIIRSGDVIPKHISTESFNEEQVFGLIDDLVQCPCCKTSTVWDETMTEVLCPNEKCPERVISKIVHFFNIMEVEDFGEPTAKMFYDNGWDTIDKILRVKHYQLQLIDGWGETSATNLINQFLALQEKEMPLAKLLHALDIFQGKIGEKDCQLIFDNLSEENLFHIEQRGHDITKDLVKIKGVGEVTAKVFQEGYSNWLGSKDMDIPIYNTYMKTPKKEATSDKYKGYNVCMTGFRDKELEDKIISGGGAICSGVSKTTTHLIVADINSGSSKMEKANKLGVKIVKREDFV
jgi:DNA ligase (NAD+)